MRLLLVGATWLVATAHVGSPDVWYSGDAGPYSVRVFVRPPKVVPGVADVVIRIRGGAQRVTVAPARSDTGDEGQPPPDDALRSAEDAEEFTAQLWLMTRGAYRIVIRVSGTQGTASLIVPVNATATARLPMSTATSAVLLAVAIFLFAGMLTIVGAAVREGVVAPGEAITAERRRRARLAMAGGGVVMLLVLFGGWRWWNAVDSWHRSRLDRPWTVQTSVGSSGALRFAIIDSIWVRRGIPRPEGYRYHTSPIVPDHGKIMHMFLVREDQGAFAHIHPTSTEQNEFFARLPSLPAGNYRVYAEIVHESGFAHTLTDTVQIPEVTPRLGTVDKDDASWRPTIDTSLVVYRWIGPPVVKANQALEFGIEAFDRSGDAITLEPYLGMAGHAAVERSDGSVFVHLHPLGTISMAAQQAVVAKSKSAAVGHANGAALANRVTFPYAFPQPGKYRVWVQVRAADELRTTAFDVVVQ